MEHDKVKVYMGRKVCLIRLSENICNAQTIGQTFFLLCHLEADHLLSNQVSIYFPLNVSFCFTCSLNVENSWWFILVSFIFYKYIKQTFLRFWERCADFFFISTVQLLGSNSNPTVILVHIVFLLFLLCHWHL